MRVVNAAQLSLMNRKQILARLREQPGATQRDLAQGLGMSLSTVSHLVTALQHEGALRRSGNARSSGGRRPDRFELRPEFRYTLVLDLTEARGARLILTDLEDRRAASRLVPLELGGTPEEMAERVAYAADDLMVERSIGRHKVLGAGVGVPAIFDGNRGAVVDSAVPMLNGVSLHRLLGPRLKVPILVENDANLAALGTARLAPEVRALAYVYVGEGLGVGLVIDGKVLRGGAGYAGEIGHLPVPGLDRSCPDCGKGCFQSVLSLPGVLAAFTGGSAASLLHNPEEQDRQMRGLKEELSKGSRAAQEAVRLFGHVMGQLVVLLFQVVDPDRIYLGGPLVEALHPHFLTETLATARSSYISNPRARAAIPVDLGQTFARMMEVGASQIVFSHWLNTGETYAAEEASP